MTRLEKLQLMQARSLRESMEMQLNLLEDSRADDLVYFYGDNFFPEVSVRSIFLGGPSPVKGHPLSERNWRCKAIKFLRRAGFTGVIYAPEPRPISLEIDEHTLGADYFTDWNFARIYRASQILFWIPKGTEAHQMPELEYVIGNLVGAVVYSDHPGRQPAKRPFIGWENGAEHTSMLRRHMTTYAQLKRYQSLGELCTSVAEAAMLK